LIVRLSIVNLLLEGYVTRSSVTWELIERQHRKSPKVTRHAISAVVAGYKSAVARTDPKWTRSATE
jgi:hypothetical protein